MFHSEELNNSLRAIKVKRMRWAGYVARMGQIRYAFKTSVGNS
jgi:hypothetical protein